MNVINFLIFITLFFYCIYRMIKVDKYNKRIVSVYTILTTITTILLINHKISMTMPLLIYISIKDYLNLIIPHRVNAILFICNLYLYLSDFQEHKLDGIIIALVIFIILYCIYIKNLIGGGDVLLIPNLALLVNKYQILSFLLYSCIIAFILYPFRKEKENSNLPFGPAIIASYIITTTIL